MRGLPIVCKAYATPPDHHDRHMSLNESHIQGQATHAEFNVPPLQCQRVVGWEPIGSNATQPAVPADLSPCFSSICAISAGGRLVAFHEQEDRRMRRAHA
jgi:hypothetical protein